MADPAYPVESMKEDLKKPALGDWEAWFDPALQKLKSSLAPPTKPEEKLPVDLGGQKGELTLKFTGKDWGGKKGPELKKGYAKTALTNLDEEVRRAYRDLSELNNNENKRDSFEVVGILAFDEAKTKQLGVSALLTVGKDGTFTTIVRSTVGDDDAVESKIERGKKFTAAQVEKDKLAVLFVRPDEPILEAMIAESEDPLASLAALGGANDAAAEQEQREREMSMQARRDADRMR